MELSAYWAPVVSCGNILLATHATWVIIGRLKKPRALHGHGSMLYVSNLLLAPSVLRSRSIAITVLSNNDAVPFLGGKIVAVSHLLSCWRQHIPCCQNTRVRTCNYQDKSVSRWLSGRPADGGGNVYCAHALARSPGQQRRYRTVRRQRSDGRGEK
jgi:hypothetical protein